MMMKHTSLALAVFLLGGTVGCLAHDVRDVGLDSSSMSPAPRGGHRHSKTYTHIVEHRHHHHGGLDCGPDGNGTTKSHSVFVACQHRMYPNCLAWNGGLCLQFQQAQ